MKSDSTKFALTLFFRAAISVVLAIVVYFSVAFIFTSIGTKVIGYTIYKQNDGQQMEKVGDYYYSELTDLEKQAEHGETSTDQETGVTTTYYRQSIRSEMNLFVKILSFIIAEICMLGIYISMLYVSAWEHGNKDIHHVRHDGLTEDKQFGLKAGIQASIPLIIAFLILFGSKLGMWLPNFAGIFKLFVFPFFPIVLKIMPSQETAQLAWWAFPIFLAMIALKPITCDIAYRLGYKDVMLRELVFYKGQNKHKKKKKSY